MPWGNTVDECKLGIMPGLYAKRVILALSKSGTLTYEAIGALVNVGLGQTTAIGKAVILLLEQT